VWHYSVLSPVIYGVTVKVKLMDKLPALAVTVNVPATLLAVIIGELA
jgi:hypothetical protein